MPRNSIPGNVENLSIVNEFFIAIHNRLKGEKHQIIHLIKSHL